mmetsp:Transcript_33005/g.65376  ORF Transcript_33005/g.65376 Transcript_33005/m.65376 type:complete len:266 (+) Transcript_33005:2695-3492(+)
MRGLLSGKNGSEQGLEDSLSAPVEGLSRTAEDKETSSPPSVQFLVRLLSRSSSCSPSSRVSQTAFGCGCAVRSTKGVVVGGKSVSTFPSASPTSDGCCSVPGIGAVFAALKKEGKRKQQKAARTSTTKRGTERKETISTNEESTLSDCSSSEREGCVPPSPSFAFPGESTGSSVNSGIQPRALSVKKVPSKEHPIFILQPSDSTRANLGSPWTAAKYFLPQYSCCGHSYPTECICVSPPGSSGGDKTTGASSRTVREVEHSGQKE